MSKPIDPNAGKNDPPKNDPPKNDPPKNDPPATEAVAANASEIARAKNLGLEYGKQYNFKATDFRMHNPYQNQYFTSMDSTPSILDSWNLSQVVAGLLIVVK